MPPTGTSSPPCRAWPCWPASASTRWPALPAAAGGVTPWLPAAANTDDPVGRLGVTHVLVGGPGDPTGQVPAFRDHAAMTPLARVTWAGQELVLYQVAPAS